MAAVGDVVLPSFTNIGEPTCASEEVAPVSENVSVIYSSIPPDVNMDSMSRATKSNAGGEMLRVSRKADGKLSIFACDSAERTSPSVYERGHSSSCVVCHRTIADREMFLNFPDDLDRRRLWGNMLGFKYSDMLRMRDGSVMLSTGLICTDHFSEECFRVFNFNKAAIETLGMPCVVSPIVRLTPSKKWIPWDCTVCSFQNHSVYAMQRHMIQHTDDVLLRYHPKSPRGLLCPFCRKCTYGYKTMSGLRRHLMTPPVQHCQLKRIFEIARNNCRSSLLEPVMKWSSWTDRNVYRAYHGCEPPPRTPRKKLDNGSSVQPESPEHSTDSSPGVLHNSSSTNSVAFSSQPASCPRGDTPDTTLLTMKTETSPIAPADSTSAYVTPPGNVSQSPLTHLRHTSSSFTRRTQQNPRRPLIFSSPVKRDATGTPRLTKTLLRPVLQLRKPLLPEDIMQRNETNVGNGQVRSQNVEQQINSDEKCRTVAKIILKATSTPQKTLLDALNLVSADGNEKDHLIADPAINKPLFACSDVVEEFNSMTFPLLPEPRPCKTRRQLESVEARLGEAGFQVNCNAKLGLKSRSEVKIHRLRLFGDCSRVEVPSGYTTIETNSGVRIVEGGASIRDPSSIISLPRGRFVPISRH